MYQLRIKNDSIKIGSIRNVLVMYEFKLGDLSGSMELNQSLAVNQQGF
ncbi:MAG: hypothetical protein RLN83_05845 [Balneola sp.]